MEFKRPNFLPRVPRPRLPWELPGLFSPQKPEYYVTPRTTTVRGFRVIIPRQLFPTATVNKTPEKSSTPKPMSAPSPPLRSPWQLSPNLSFGGSDSPLSRTNWSSSSESNGTNSPWPVSPVLPLPYNGLFTTKTLSPRTVELPCYPKVQASKSGSTPKRKLQWKHCSTDPNWNFTDSVMRIPRLRKIFPFKKPKSVVVRRKFNLDLVDLEQDLPFSETCEIDDETFWGNDDLEPLPPAFAQVVDLDDELYNAYLMRPDKSKTCMCILCYEWMSSRSQLEKHLTEVHRDNMILYGCRYCDQQFWSRFLRHRHEKTHLKRRREEGLHKQGQAKGQHVKHCTFPLDY